MTNAPVSAPPDVRGLLNRLLDKGYTQVTDQTMRAVLRNSVSGVMEMRLAQFEAEAKRLAEKGEKFTSDNPVFRALMADFDATLAKNTALLESVAPDVQDSGWQTAEVAARQLTLPGISDQALQAVGVDWVRPDPEAVARLVDYSSKPAFRALLDNYQMGVSDAAQQAFLRGIALGKGPLTTARELRDIVEGLPTSDANAIARTLQLQSYRTATAANYAANADILEEDGIRIETLDDRICVSCVSLHGTPSPIDEPPDEHWNGRAVVVALLKGRGRDVQTGADWFDSLSEDQQQNIMGDAAHAAWRAGDVALSDFVARHDDPTFGGMIHEASLKGILGDKAKDYYQK